MTVVTPASPTAELIAARTMRRRLRTDDLGSVLVALCAEARTLGFERSLVLTVEPHGLLAASAIGPLGDPGSDALRRRVRAQPIQLDGDCRETEIIRACAAGREAKDRPVCAIETALDLDRTSIVALAPEGRALALLVGVLGEDTPTDADAKLAHLVQIAEPVLESVVLKLRLNELDAELRFLTASAKAYIREAIESPITLTADHGHGVAFPPAARTFDRTASELLTPRETDVLRLISAGLRNRDIADELHLSTETVKDHVGSLLRKLGASNRVEAVTGYLRAGGTL